MKNRARDQMREIGNEQAVFHEAPLMRIAAIDVGEIGDLGESEERNAERQHDRERWVARVSHGVENLNAEIGVFIEAKRDEIGGDGKRE